MNRLFGAACFLALLLGTLSAAGQCPLVRQFDCGFLYENGHFSSIAYVQADGTSPLGIQNGGVVSGSIIDTRNHGFLLAGRVFTIFNHPMGVNTVAYGLNNQGSVVGYYEDVNFIFHGFIKDGDIYTTLDYPGAAATFPYGINDNGVVVGEYRFDLQGVSHGFIYENGSYATLDYPAAQSTVPTGVNNLGQIVGYAGGGADEFAFLYSDGQFTKITYAGQTYIYADGLNNNGKIVGSIYDPQAGISHGFVWSQGIFTLIDVAGSSSTACTSINDNDQVVGTALQLHNANLLLGRPDFPLLTRKPNLSPSTF